MSAQLVCWKCGASLADLPLPLSRLAACPRCHADVHVCRLCEFYDPRLSHSCREPVAEEVTDKERANFCGYFRAKAGAYRATEDFAARQAREQLDALFGVRRDNGAGEESSEAERARTELERLFGLNDGKDK